jgi:hypothetical protein
LKDARDREGTAGQHNLRQSAAMLRDKNQAAELRERRFALVKRPRDEFRTSHRSQRQWAIQKQVFSKGSTSLSRGNPRQLVGMRLRKR